jgi:frataxin
VFTDNYKRKEKKMKDEDFDELAEECFEDIIDWIEGDLVDIVGISVDIHEGVMTIDVDGKGEFVVSKHGPSNQMWLASPVSGADKFSHTEEGWVNAHAVSLMAVLEEEIAGE